MRFTSIFLFTLLGFVMADTAEVNDASEVNEVNEASEVNAESAEALRFYGGPVPIVHEVVEDAYHGGGGLLGGVGGLLGGVGRAVGGLLGGDPYYHRHYYHRGL